MCKELILKNTKTDEMKSFYDVSKLEVPGYEVRSFHAIIDLTSKIDVKSFSFSHSKGNSTFPTDTWRPIKLLY